MERSTAADRVLRGVQGANRGAQHQVVPDTRRTRHREGDHHRGGCVGPGRRRGPGEAWYRGNVVQCGYCQPGQTLAASALLETDRSPDDAAIGRWMNGNLCRCGTYPRIRDAIGQAAGALAAGRVTERVPVVPVLETQPLTEE